MTTGPERIPFSGADSALGYLYQCRLALLLALQRIRAGEDFLLKLETLDDVVFERDGDPPALLQTKHHRSRPADLTDASTDLWKTIRIWSEGLARGTVPTGSSLYLVSTSRAGEGSAARYLRPAPERDTAKALQRLLATVRTSISKVNRPAYAAFVALGAKRQREMLENVVVLDSAPTILNLEEELRGEVRWAVERQHTDSFLARLEGWWFRRTIHLLASTGADAALSREIEAQMDDLREQFKREALPIDPDILAAQVDASEYADAVFVKQLQLIGIGAQRVLAAIREYFRAFEQRSRWLREDLLLVGELDMYERRLVEEWRLVFDGMRDELDDDAVEEVKQKAARELYRWVETTARVPIRPNVTEPFVTRGSYQLLADKLRVGWHPEFMTRLRHLLEVQEVSQ